jgi:hypothetical protein
MLLVAVLLSRFIDRRNTWALLGVRQAKMDQVAGNPQQQGVNS